MFLLQERLNLYFTYIDMFLVVCTDIQLVRVVKNHHLHYKSCVSLLAEEYKYSAQSADCPNPIVPERPAQKFHPKMKRLTLRTLPEKCPHTEDISGNSILEIFLVLNFVIFFRFLKWC